MPSPNPYPDILRLGKQVEQLATRLALLESEYRLTREVWKRDRQKLRRLTRRIKALESLDKPKD